MHKLIRASKIPRAIYRSDFFASYHSHDHGSLVDGCKFYVSSIIVINCYYHGSLFDCCIFGDRGVPKLNCKKGRQTVPMILSRRDIRHSRLKKSSVH